MSVYSNDGSVDPVEPEEPEPEEPEPEEPEPEEPASESYLGCFGDDQDARVFSVAATMDSGSMTAAVRAAFFCCVFSSLYFYVGPF